MSSDPSVDLRVAEHLQTPEADKKTSQEEQDALPATAVSPPDNAVDEKGLDACDYRGRFIPTPYPLTQSMDAAGAPSVELPEAKKKKAASEAGKKKVAEARKKMAASPAAEEGKRTFGEAVLAQMNDASFLNAIDLSGPLSKLDYALTDSTALWTAKNVVQAFKHTIIEALLVEGNTRGVPVTTDKDKSKLISKSMPKHLQSSQVAAVNVSDLVGLINSVVKCPWFPHMTIPRTFLARIETQITDSDAGDKVDAFQLWELFASFNQLVQDASAKDIYYVILVSHVFRLHRSVTSTRLVRDWPDCMRNALQHSQIVTSNQMTTSAISHSGGNVDFKYHGDLKELTKCFLDLFRDILKFVGTTTKNDNFEVKQVLEVDIETVKGRADLFGNPYAPFLSSLEHKIKNTSTPAHSRELLESLKNSLKKAVLTLPVEHYFDTQGNASRDDVPSMLDALKIKKMLQTFQRIPWFPMSSLPTTFVKRISQSDKLRRRVKKKNNDGKTYTLWEDDVWALWQLFNTLQQLVSDFAMSGTQDIFSVIMVVRVAELHPFITSCVDVMDWPSKLRHAFAHYRYRLFAKGVICATNVDPTTKEVDFVFSGTVFDLIETFKKIFEDVQVYQQYVQVYQQYKDDGKKKKDKNSWISYSTSALADRKNARLADVNDGHSGGSEHSTRNKSRSPSNRAHKKPCKFFAEGSCRKNNQCTFSHTEGPWRRKDM